MDMCNADVDVTNFQILLDLFLSFTNVTCDSLMMIPIHFIYLCPYTASMVLMRNLNCDVALQKYVLFSLDLLIL